MKKSQEEMDRIMEQTKLIHGEIKALTLKHFTEGIEPAAVASALASNVGFIAAIIAHREQMSPQKAKEWFELATKAIRTQAEGLLKVFLEKDIEEAAENLTKAVAKDTAKKEAGRWG